MGYVLPVSPCLSNSIAIQNGGGVFAFCRVHFLVEKYLTDFLVIVELCVTRAHALLVQPSVRVVVLIRILCHLLLAPV